MKKYANVCSMLALAAVVLLIMSACSEDSDGPSPGRGVLGQITGVLYDTVTLQPVEGVDVELGSLKTKTNKSGYFIFKNVGVGKQVVSFLKSGYRFITKEVEVDARQYIRDDPFLEVEALNKQLEALLDWAKNKYPDYGDGTLSGAWTYQDGIWINGDGTAVTINNEGKFEVEEIKLNYTYNYHIPLQVIGVTPLNGAGKGTVKLVKTTYNGSKTVVWGDIVPIGEGVDLWFTDSDNFEVGLEGTDAVGGEALFGPFKTKADGTFEVTGLPAETPLSLVFNGFTKDGFFYKFASPVYSYDTDTYAFVKEEEIKVKSFPNTNGYTEIGDLYIFAEGSFVLINAISAGTAADPLEPTDAITVTFSEAMNPAGFSAIVNLDSNAIGGTGVVSLKVAEWNENTVTLIPDPVGVHPRLKLPLSDNQTLQIGTVHIEGTAASGSKLYNNDLPVFTAEGIKLINVNLAPTDIPARPYRTIINTAAIELTFSKPIIEASRFEWTVADTHESLLLLGYASWQFAPGNQAVVYIYTDELTTLTGSRCLYYRVYSEADPEDSAEYCVGDFEKMQYLEQPLTLVSTNLYEDKEAGDTHTFTVGTGGAGTFDSGTTDTTTKAITLTFNRDIPEGATVRVGFNTVTINVTPLSANSPYPITVTPNGGTISIKPNTRLDPDTVYYISVRIISKDGQDLFDNTYLPVYNDVIAAITTASAPNTYVNIAFRTKVNPVRFDMEPVFGTETGTSPQFSVDASFLITNSDPVVDIKLGEQYYIQFTSISNDTLKYYGNASYTSGDFIVAITQIAGSNVLGITITRRPGGDPLATQTDAFSLEGDQDNRKINTADGNLSFDVLTIKP